MIVEVEEASPGLAKLNSKIQEYNKMADSNDNALKVSLLEELHFIQNFLYQENETIMLNTLSDQATYNLKILEKWPGISKELAHLNLSNMSDRALEKKFVETNKSNEFLPNRGVFSNLFSNLFLKLNKEIKQDLGEIINKKAHQSSGKEVMEYYHDLKQFKQKLLHQICFGDMGDKDIKNARELMAKVNHEISATHGKNNNFILKDEQQDNADALGITLNSLTSQNLAQLVEVLNEKDANKAYETLAQNFEKVKELKSFDVQFLGGANNKNWKLTNTNYNNSQHFILRLEEPNRTPGFLNQLHNTACAHYFTDDYASSKLSLGADKRVVLTEFVAGRNLEADRENLDKNNDDTGATIRNKAADRIGQLTQFCQSLLTQRGIYPDIKLANFLVDEDGKLKVSDKKAIVQLEANAPSVALRGLQTTKDYEPPESRGKIKSVDAEAWMTYQIGLALYDYLTRDPNQDWPNNMNFNHSVFKTEDGQKLQELIIATTQKEPEARPSLSQVNQQLKEVIEFGKQLNVQEKKSVEKAPLNNDSEIKENPLLKLSEKKVQALHATLKKSDVKNFISEDNSNFVSKKSANNVDKKEKQVFFKNPIYNNPLDEKGKEEMEQPKKTSSSVRSINLKGIQPLEADGNGAVMTRDKKGEFAPLNNYMKTHDIKEGMNQLRELGKRKQEALKEPPKEEENIQFNNK